MNQVIRTEDGVEEVMAEFPSPIAAASFAEFLLLNEVTRNGPFLIYAVNSVAGEGFALTQSDKMITYKVRTKGE